MTICAGLALSTAPPMVERSPVAMPKLANPKVGVEPVALRPQVKGLAAARISLSQNTKASQLKATRGREKVAVATTGGGLICLMRLTPRSAVSSCSGGMRSRKARARGLH